MRLMNINEIADYMKVTTRTIYNFIRYHGMPYVKVSGTLRFNFDDVNSWLIGYTKTNFKKKRRITHAQNKNKINLSSQLKQKSIRDFCMRIRDEVLQNSLDI
ncbi:MAG: excisionase family DNA-binding protein [bacterium]|nr:excisionase family DNA-binding protein [bacterium]